MHLRLPLALVSVIVSVLVTACGASEDAASSAQAATPAPTAKNDCGDVTFGLGAACPADRVAKFDCFLEAKRTCTSSRIGITYTSDEGGLTIDELVIDGACNVLVRGDNTRDPWAAKPGVTTTTCTDVSLIAIGDADKCSTLHVDRCP